MCACPLYLLLPQAHFPRSTVVSLGESLRAVAQSGSWHRIGTDQMLVHEMYGQIQHCRCGQKTGPRF